MTGKARNAVRTSAPESATPEWVSIGMRLMAMRTGTNQETQAARLGVHKNTYARWERGEREIGADGLKRLVELGFDANWILTGEGEPVPGEVIVGAGAESTSQSLSETVLNIALELADESCRDATSVREAGRAAVRGPGSGPARRRRPAHWYVCRPGILHRGDHR